MMSDDLCAETLRELAGLQLHLHVCADPVETGLTGGQWLEAADLLLPAQAPMSGVLARFADTGGASNQRLASASFLLRFGWAAGFPIASYLACNRVPMLDDYALLFAPSSLLHTLQLRRVTFQAPHAGRRRRERTVLTGRERTWLRRQLFKSLWQLTAPVVAAQHGWSRYSRHALWSMVVSSWGALFTSLGRQLGDASWGIAEARALFALHPELARAAPELYEVCMDDSACTCQRRAACCLYFKRQGQTFCASCPLLPEDERLARNRAWVRDRRPVVCA